MINIFENPESLVDALADFIAAEAKTAIETRGKFDFVLSGGNSPRKLYERLASQTFQNRIEWQKVFFFFGDERYVPVNHPDSNFRMVDESPFKPLGIINSQIFAINTLFPPAVAASEYEQRIIQHFGNQDYHFDLILLGLGDNAHTASLFPHNTVLQEKKAFVKDAFVETLNVHRITFTARLINLARIVVFLVLGESKAGAVQRVLRYPIDTEEFPAQLIHPDHGALFWFLDREAAGKI